MQTKLIKNTRTGLALGVTILAFVSCLRSASSQAPLAMTQGTIVAQGAKLEKVYFDGFWLEGPAQGPDGQIYFSDVTMTWRTGMSAGATMRFDPKTGQTSVYRSPSAMSNGIAFDSQGRMVVAHGADFGGRFISRTDLSTGKATILAGLYNGKPFNSPNDLDIDSEGRIYFTDPRYFGHEPIDQPVNGVYRIDTNGMVHLILADVARPNGIAISPDQRTLYVTELDFFLADRRIEAGVPWRSGDMKILKYELSSNGTAKNRSVFVDYGAEDGGGADGIKVDRDGNVYAAVQTTKRFGVRVYSPDASEIAYIPLPEKPNNVALASHDGRNWPYIATQGGALYRIETRIPPSQFASKQR